MSIISFLNEVDAVYKKGNATEHSYRPALSKLFNSLAPGITATNEPRREKVGAPDFVFQRGEIVIGHCEAKDLGVDLTKMKGPNEDQKKRYVGALSNLIYTNCLDWAFYRDGELIAEISIADCLTGIQPKPTRFDALTERLQSFIAQKPQSITSSKQLAGRMAGKAILIKDILANALREDKDLRSELAGQYNAFKEHLIHDITADDFADIYAETIAYGMFAARLHDTTLGDFTRQEALDLLPKSNPFLRNLFSFIAGPNLDERISWVIDDLAEIFQATNVADLMRDFGKTTQRNDPFLHFYETFLAAYNPKKRKARGVWYTPEPVVNFIVRAVDDVLIKEFGLPMGLADTSKVTIPWDTGQKDKKGNPVIGTKEVHRVQILDPATGTGTFLAEVIKQIAPKVKAAAPASWNSYVEKDLIPRLHGFELLMASYAMCHLKLDMMLTELGYKPTSSAPRLSVYLTNSLEEGEPANQTLPFAQWLSNEVKQANAIKRDMPIMCVIGNPPYSVSSQNRGEWIDRLLDEYKFGLTEKKINLDDDYIKFIRLAQFLIKKNGSGIVGHITNNSFIDGVTHRVMRESLLETFDVIYIFDLHGSTKKKEKSPDGSVDQNVFDIQQGVSLCILIKLPGSSRKSSAKVFHADLYGDRASKYDALWKCRIGDRAFERLAPEAPYHFFKPKNFKHDSLYKDGFQITDMLQYTSGIQSKRDKVTIQISMHEIKAVVSNFVRQPEHELRNHYALPPDGRDWTLNWAIADLKDHGDFATINYRPFDNRFTRYSGKTKGFIAYPRHLLSQHMLAPDKNIALLFCRQLSIQNFAHVFCSKFITDLNSVSINSKEQTYFAPLYLDATASDLDQTRRVNFDPKLYRQLREKAGLRPHPEVPAQRASKDEAAHASRPPSAAPRHERGSTATPQHERGFIGAAPGEEANEVDVFDYIYGVLHCPAYRETYAEFLKIDFPRIPWPKSPEVFWSVREKGEQLRRLHLMEDAAIGATPYPFEGAGDGVIEKPEFRDGRVYINKTQYFANAPEVSWGFYIGGYQPAQKWLKDRKGRELSFDDVRHYQKILKILAETDRIMKTIEMPL